MRWELAVPERRAVDSQEDWDLHVDEHELDVVGFVSLMKNGHWRSMSFMDTGNGISMHLTKEEAQEACVTELVKWRLR